MLAISASIFLPTARRKWHIFFLLLLCFCCNFWHVLLYEDNAWFRGNSRKFCREYDGHDLTPVEMKKANAASSARPKLKEGQAVTVFYDPADPGNFYVPEDADSRSTGRLFIIIGAAAAVLGVVLFLI